MIATKIKRLVKKKSYIFMPVAFLYYLAIKLKGLTNLSNVFYSICYYRSLRILLSNHLTIGIKKLALARTKFPHPVGIVIGMGVVIGNDCKIYQNVTIGLKSESDSKYPKIGSNVTIYANAIILGNIEIGDNSIIGASTLLMQSVPSNSVVAGNPGKVINMTTPNTINKA